MNETPIEPGVVLGRLVSFPGPMLRHPKAMGPQFRVEGILAELPEVRGQTQAFQLMLLMVASVVRIRHRGALPSRETSGRTATLSLSVVQTTEPKPPRNRSGFAK